MMIEKQPEKQNLKNRCENRDINFQEIFSSSKA